jgi:transcriptional repressor NrdR
VDSRLTTEGDSIRRRRECEGCERRFTTYERIDGVVPFVIKKDGSRSPFDRDKVIAGIRRACQKRPVAITAIEGFARQLELRLQEGGEREIQSRRIGEEVMTFLREADDVAYVRFASVYRSFKDVGEFMDELKDLISEAGTVRRNKDPDSGG